MVLSAERPIRELFDGLSGLLESYVDASIVFIALASGAGPVASYVYMDGVSGEPDRAQLSANSTSLRVFESGTPVRYERASDWPGQHLVALHGKTLRPEAAIFVPIVFGGERVGVLSVQSTIQNAYTEDDVVLLETCALYLGARIDDDARRETAQRYERLAAVDVLTGVANRGALDQALDREWRRAVRSRSSIAFLMIDVDFFKAFNDSNGHVAGDSCLQQVSGIASDCLLRPTDLFARYGGEEFAVVLPDTELDAAVRIAETMRAAVERRAIPHGGSSLGLVSISIGAAAFRPGGDDEAAALVRSADTSLYEAKHRGRNRVCAEGYASHLTPSDSRVLVRGNLPLPRTRFIGRGNDCAQLLAAVAGHRLTTAVGPGGVGKTRIAIEVARELAPGYPDGAWFVDLTSISDPAELPEFVSLVLKELVSPQRTVPGLATALRDVNALLVLDNCEHMIEGCAGLVEQIMINAGNVRVLATSREALGIAGECVYWVAALDVDDGVALFVDRALSAGLTGTIASSSAIGEIVRQLDGLPLAIELAAPRLTTLTFEELRAGLGSRLSLLRGTNRSAPSRQQTLRALMEWSYRLLEPAEQTVFRRLAVFRRRAVYAGGWTREAAEAVCADESLSQWDVGVALDGLVSKSLLQTELAYGTTRLRMLEATHEYAAEILGDSADAAEAAVRHARTYLELALELGSNRERMTTTMWHRAVTMERGNLQVALFSLLDARRYDEAAHMLLALRDWLWDRGAMYARDLPARLEEALRDEGALSTSARAALALCLSTIVRRFEPERALRLAVPVYKEYAAAGNAALAAAGMRVIAQAQLMLTGTIDAALEVDLANLADRMEAEGNLYLSALLLNLLGTLHTQNVSEARLGRALAAFERAIVLLEARGDADRAGTLYGNCADVLFYLGNIGGALERARRAVDLIEHSEEPWYAAFQHMNLGHFATWAGDFETARAALRAAYARLVGLEGYTAGTIADKFARLAFAAGQFERSTALLAAADITFERNGVARQRREAAFVETMRADLRENAGFAFDAAYRRGSGLTAEELEAEVLLV
jgi:diguanylate cyclase (GGDEF)-like protein